jgi:hypothetical protein
VLASGHLPVDSDIIVTMLFFAAARHSVGALTSDDAGAIRHRTTRKL